MPQWLDEAGDAIRSVIRAYHGSPYDFDKFDASKIGTGEGAQAYGHGLYFAQSPAVAEEYKKSVPLWPQYESPEQMAADYLHVHGTPADAMRMMKDHGMWKGSRNRREMYRGALQLLADGVPIKPKEFPFIEHPPRTYEVEIAYPEESLLDYDAPWSAQPPAVNKAVRKLAVGLPDEPPAEAIFGAMVNNEPGGVVYHRLAGALGENAELWRKPYREIAGQSARMASQALGEQGIPGIRYLDGLSRNAGQGTRNYVMFPGTEDSIRILRKYGIMAPVAAGAASQYNDAP
jgi:hypothetical protein